jgi:streptogrisin C
VFNYREVDAMRGHRLAAAVSATVLAAGSIAVANPAAAAGANCTGYQHTRTGRATEGAVDTPWLYFLPPGSGEIKVCLDGPDGVDFDLVLVRFTSEGPQTVATATGEGPDKTLTYFNSGAGNVYRADVVATRGSGLYTAGLNLP